MMTGWLAGVLIQVYGKKLSQIVRYSAIMKLDRLLLLANKLYGPLVPTGR